MNKEENKIERRLGVPGVSLFLNTSHQRESEMTPESDTTMGVIVLCMSFLLRVVQVSADARHLARQLNVS